MIKTMEKIVCDFCGVTGGDADHLRAVKNGWVNLKGKDICPHCVNVLLGETNRKEIVPERMTNNELASVLLEESEWAADNNWDVPIMLPDELKEAAKRIGNKAQPVWHDTRTTPPKVGEDVLFYDRMRRCFVGYRTGIGDFRVRWDGMATYGVPDFWTPIHELPAIEKVCADEEV